MLSYYPIDDSTCATTRTMEKMHDALLLADNLAGVKFSCSADGATYDYGIRSRPELPGRWRRWRQVLPNGNWQFASTHARMLPHCGPYRSAIQLRKDQERRYNSMTRGAPSNTKSQTRRSRGSSARRGRGRGRGRGLRRRRRRRDRHCAYGVASSVDDVAQRTAASVRMCVEPRECAIRSAAALAVRRRARNIPTWTRRTAGLPAVARPVRTALPKLRRPRRPSATSGAARRLLRAPTDREAYFQRRRATSSDAGLLYFLTAS